MPRPSVLGTRLLARLDKQSPHRLVSSTSCKLDPRRCLFLVEQARYARQRLTTHCATPTAVSSSTKDCSVSGTKVSMSGIMCRPAT